MRCDVVVVGAGVSGLNAARILESRGHSVIVVEASECVGGRIKQTSDEFVDWKVDLGAEIIHGKNTLLWDLIDANSWEMEPIFSSNPNTIGDGQTSEYFWINRESNFHPYNTPDKDIRNLIELMDKLGRDGKYLEKNLSVFEYLVENGIPERVIGLADALWGKYYGSQIDKIGYNEIVEEQKNIVPIEGNEFNYRLKDTFRVLVDYLRGKLRILTRWQAKKVHYSGNLIRVYNQDKEFLEAKKVVISVPLTVIQDGDIEFVPSLPQSKMEAAKSLDMESACKIVCKFSKCFWPREMQLIICSDCVIPEIWVGNRPCKDVGNAPWIMVGFSVGDAAKCIQDLNDDAITTKMLLQLNQMFGNTENLTPASNCFLGSTIYKWNANPFIRGGYSCVGLKSLNSRQILSQNVNEKIFFCGEATCVTEEPGTVNGALASGMRAADEILISFINSQLALVN